MGTAGLTRLLVLGLVACSPAAANERTSANRLLAHEAGQRALVAGTLIRATTLDALSSRRNTTGETLTALVSGDVEDAHGQVVIPAGSRVALRIAQSDPATTTRRRSDGMIALDVTSLTIRGREYPVRARVEPTRPKFQGRDVVVPPGTAILFVLPELLNVETRRAQGAGGIR
jgi:hypothetical protein